MELLATVAIGFGSGVLSGMFGIGGGVASTPAIRLLLGAPALVAVGTPLVAIFPSALTGSRAYARQGLADVRAGVILGISGSATAVLGAWLAGVVGGHIVLLVTAGVILYTAVDMVMQVVRPPRIELLTAEEADAATPPAVGAPMRARTHPRIGALVALGAITGLYSGFLGLGGGFVLVPMLSRWLAFPVKVAIGTSLTALSILSLPGIATHAVLGHVDWVMAAGLTFGVIPGALVGARITFGASDRVVRLAFAALLVLVGALLAASEITGWVA